MMRMTRRPTMSTLLIFALAGAVGGSLGLGLGLLVVGFAFWFLLLAAIPVGAAVTGVIATWLTIALRWVLRDRTPAWPWRSVALWGLGSPPIAYATILVSPSVHDNLVIDGALVLSRASTPPAPSSSATGSSRATHPRPACKSWGRGREENVRMAPIDYIRATRLLVLTPSSPWCRSCSMETNLRVSSAKI